jgi:hypothetical protein
MNGTTRQPTLPPIRVAALAVATMLLPNLLGISSLIHRSVLARTSTPIGGGGPASPVGPGELAVGAGPTEVVSAIEEEWEAVLAPGDGSAEGPRIVTVMSPAGDEGSASSLVFVLDLRGTTTARSSAPSLQCWYVRNEDLDGLRPPGEGRAASAPRPGQNGEVIRWTQRIALEDGHLSGGIEGLSSTAGGLDGVAGPKFRIATPLTDLAGYRKARAAAHASANGPGGSVAELTLRRVRYYGSDSVAIDENPTRVVP